jgi:hypothetical protein
MVYCGVTPPYPIPMHPIEGDDSHIGSQNHDALGSYTWRHRDISRFGAGSVTTGQPDDAYTRYGED